MSEIIGNKLKKILKRKGINAKEFGEMINQSSVCINIIMILNLTLIKL